MATETHGWLAVAYLLWWLAMVNELLNFTSTTMETTVTRK